MRAGRMVMGSIVVREARAQPVSVELHSDGRAARFASFVARNMRQTSTQPASRAPAVGEATRAS